MGLVLCACAPLGTREADLQFAQSQQTIGLVGGLLCGGDAACEIRNDTLFLSGVQSELVLREGQRQQDAADRRHGAVMQAIERDRSGSHRSREFCFEGHYDGRSFGECRASQEWCAAVMDRRIEEGVDVTKDCRYFPSVACFTAAQTLEQSPREFCFPSPDVCEHYQSSAEAREFDRVSTCGVFDGCIGPGCD